MKTLEEVLAELSKPFLPSKIYWKPGMVNKDGTKALAMPYATLRVYQNRLDAVCGLDWSVTYTPWGNKIVCHLTIGGVTRSSTGEPDKQAEKAEIAGTAAEAQAFKRACSAFSLGRYLYHLPAVWVDYDAHTKQFTAQAKATLHGIIVQHYHRTMQAQTDERTSPELAVDDSATKQETDAAAVARAQVSESRIEQLRKQFHRLGRELYGDTWDEVRHHNVARITNDQSTSVNDLTAEQVQKLIDGLQQLKRQRRATREEGKESPQ